MFKVNFDFGELKVEMQKHKRTELHFRVSKVKQRRLPRKFVEHILALGFDKSDAVLLYENKDDWMGIELGQKIKCAEAGCKFMAELAANCLVAHCSEKHDWRDYPCHYKNCNWVSYSSTSFKRHVSKFHEEKHATHYEHKCDYANCFASFDRRAKVKLHAKIHQNIAFGCQFCTYRNSARKALVDHMANHFENRSFMCELCDKKYSTRSQLNIHFEAIHEAIEVKCPICDRKGNVRNIRQHILDVHKLKGSSYDRSTKLFILPEKS